MAGYKRPYPDAWGSNYYPPDRSSQFGGSYYSGMQWGQGYSGHPGSTYPPPPRDYYPSPAPVTGEYYSSPAPPQRDPPPPGDWDYAPPVKKDYNPAPPGNMPGQYNPAQSMQPKRPDGSMDFTDDYSAFYGDKSSYNNRGSRGGPFRGRGRGGGYAGRGGSTQYDNQEHSSNRGGFRGRGSDRGRGGFRGRGSQRGGDSRGGRGGERGLPPNQFSGRGRARGNSGSVPPVHSLAKEKTTFLDVAKMSVPEKLHRFCLYLKDTKHDKGNAIQTINNALSASKLSMDLEFNHSGLAWVSNTKVFTGAIKLDGVFIARSLGLSKKEMKLSTYEKALEVFLTHTVAEIYNLKDPGPEHIKEQILADRKTKEELSSKKLDLEKELSMTPLEKLVHDIKINPQADNIIHTVENACNRQFSSTYKFEVEPANSLFFVGKFTFDGIVLARSNAPSKKLCKRNTLASAFERLTTLPMEELLKDVPELTIKAMVEDGKGYCADKSARKEPLDKRFEQLISILNTSSLSNGISHTVDMASMNCGLYPTLVYRSMETEGKENMFKCELYIERIYIAEGEAAKKRESSPDAYMKAYNVLKSTPIETLLNEHRRMTDEEIHSPKSVDMIFKGTGRVFESNIEMLKKAGFNPDNLTNKMEDMVMVENHGWSKDRLKHAFCILKYACANNGLFLQWEAEAILTHNTFKCTVYINGEEVGYSYGFGRNHAKCLGCLDALYKLYAKYDIIILHNYHVVEDCLKYEDLKAEVKKLQESGVEPVAPVFDVEEDHDLPDQYFSTHIQRMLDEYVGKHNEEEYSQLVFGHGFTAPEWQDLKNRTKKMNLKYFCQRHEEEDCFIIAKRMSYQNLAKFMKQKGVNRLGKFELVEGDDKPKYADIETYLMKEFPDNSSESSGRDLRNLLKSRLKYNRREEKKREARRLGEDEKESDDIDMELAKMAKDDIDNDPKMTGLDYRTSKQTVQF